MSTLPNWKELVPGVYSIEWEDESISVAAIGMSSNGDMWFAPANWCGGTVLMDDHPEIKSVTLIRSSHSERKKEPAPKCDRYPTAEEFERANRNLMQSLAESERKAESLVNELRKANENYESAKVRIQAQFDRDSAALVEQYDSRLQAMTNLLAEREKVATQTFEPGERVRVETYNEVSVVGVIEAVNIHRDRIVTYTVLYYVAGISQLAEVRADEVRLLDALEHRAAPLVPQEDGYHSAPRGTADILSDQEK